ncbi:cytosine permease, partial [Sulfobacillus harzensis]
RTRPCWSLVFSCSYPWCSRFWDFPPVKLPRSRTIFVDAVLSIGVALIVLLHATGFIGTFESFLSILAGVLSPWAAIFLWETPRLARGAGRDEPLIRWPTFIAWMLGLAASLLTTSSTLFNGPWAVGIFQGSSLNYVLGFLVSGLIYGIWRLSNRGELFRSH